MKDLSDSGIRAMWRAAGGEFHGPIVEHGSIKEGDLIRFVRNLYEEARAEGRSEALRDGLARI